MGNGFEFLMDMNDAEKEAERQLGPYWLIKERTKVMLLEKENKELKDEVEECKQSQLCDRTKPKPLWDA